MLAKCGKKIVTCRESIASYSLAGEDPMVWVAPGLPKANLKVSEASGLPRALV